MTRRPADDIHLDARAIKVLAHPLRSRLLTELRLHGPATATELAKRLDTNSGQTSYHLRQLADVGLVEDTNEGHGRRREWRATTQSHSWDPSDFTDDPDAQASMQWLEGSYLDQIWERERLWLQRRAEWPMGWADALGVGDVEVVATPDQARQLHQELWEVFGRYATIGAGDPTARQISVAVMSAPIDLDPPHDA